METVATIQEAQSQHSQIGLLTLWKMNLKGKAIQSLLKVDLGDLNSQILPKG